MGILKKNFRNIDTRRIGRERERERERGREGERERRLQKLTG
jgi:hypothetical protein